eukprot:gb/GEZN01000341.1/.p1 GENE.gb/GEZN01000341.1/~~gb/GEZN01000341.1/.p1  ORF type:complete len:1523 (-),score=339.43 gb/GEZN01000341.1/:28-4596(-)
MGEDFNGETGMNTITYWKHKFEEAVAELDEFKQVTAQMDEDMEQEITQMQRESAASQERADKFEQLYKSLKDTSSKGSSDLTEELFSLQDKLQQANQRLEVYKKEKRDLEIRTEQLETMKRRYEAELDDQKEKLEDAMEDQVVLQGDIQDVGTQKDAEIQRLQEELRNLRGDSAALRVRLSGQGALPDSTTPTGSKRQPGSEEDDEDEDGRESRAELEARLTDLTEKLQETESQMRELEKEMDETSTDLFNSENRSHDLETKLEEAQLALKKAQSNSFGIAHDRSRRSEEDGMRTLDLQVLRAQVEAKEAEVQRLRLAQEELEAELAEQRHCNEDLNLDARETSQKLQQAEEQAKSLLREKAQLTKQIQQTNSPQSSQVEDVQRAKADLEEQVANLEEQVANLEMKLQAKKLVSSSSAVITRQSLAQGPLLSLSAATRGLKTSMSSWREEIVQNQEEFGELHGQLASALQQHFASQEREHAEALQNQALEQLQLVNELQEHKGGNIRVVCRVRPLLSYETKRGATLGDTLELAPDGKGLSLIRQDGDTGAKDTQHFFFDKVLPPSDGTAEAFAQVKNMLDSVLHGHNVCIFAYGQTGSGKTHTMEGSEQEPGISYRSAEHLFNLMEQRKAHFSFTVRMTLVEIYNENLRDLLREVDRSKVDGAKVITPSQNGHPTPSKLIVRHDKDGRTFVLGASYVEATSAKEVMALLTAAKDTRAEAATALNSHSSRSHLVLTLNVTATSTHTQDASFGKLCLVDLAGSERVKMSEAAGKQFEEATYINKSLSALGNVMLQLTSASSGRPHVPFRDSKLTYMLQDALQGNSKTLMFVNVSPAQFHALETLCSLQFAKRVRKVKLGASTASVENGSLMKYKQELDHQKLENAKMKKKLEAERDRLREELREKDSALTKLERKVKEVGSQGSNAKGELRDRLEQERHAAQKAERKLGHQLKLLEATVKESKAELEKTNLRLMNAKEQIQQQERLQKGGDAASSEVRKQAEQIRKLKKKLDLAEKAAKEHQEKRADTRGEVSTLRLQMQATEDELRRMLDVKEREIRELRKSTGASGGTSFANIAAERMAGRARLLTENKRLKSMLDDLQSQVSTLKLQSQSAKRKAGIRNRTERNDPVELDVSESNHEGTAGARLARGARPNVARARRPAPIVRSNSSTPGQSPLPSPRHRQLTKLSVEDLGKGKSNGSGSKSGSRIDSPVTHANGTSGSKAGSRSQSPVNNGAQHNGTLHDGASNVFHNGNSNSSSPRHNSNGSTYDGSNSNGVIANGTTYGNSNFGSKTGSPISRKRVTFVGSKVSNGISTSSATKSRTRDRTGGIMRPTAASAASQVRRSAAKDASKIVKPIVLRPQKKSTVNEDDDEDPEGSPVSSVTNSPRKLVYDDDIEKLGNVLEEQEQKDKDSQPREDSDSDKEKENKEKLAPGYVKTGGAILVASKRPTGRSGRQPKENLSDVKAGKALLKKGATIEEGVKKAQQEKQVKLFDTTDLSSFGSSSDVNFSRIDQLLASFDSIGT